MQAHPSTCRPLFCDLHRPGSSQCFQTFALQNSFISRFIIIPTTSLILHPTKHAQDMTPKEDQRRTGTPVLLNAENLQSKMVNTLLRGDTRRPLLPRALIVQGSSLAQSKRCQCGATCLALPPPFALIGLRPVQSDSSTANTGDSHLDMQSDQ